MSSLTVAYWLALGLRGYLMTRAELTGRTELATPLNAHPRLVEGVALKRAGVDPYSGVLFHEPPLLLGIFDEVSARLPPNRVSMIYIVLDFVTALVLGQVAKAAAKAMLARQEKEKDGYHEDAKKGERI